MKGTEYRISEVSEVVGASVDSVRRWIDTGRLKATKSAGGHRIVAGQDLAAFVESGLPEASHRQSARNRFPGIVTRVERDRVAAKVELFAGGHRLVALLTREAVDDLGLARGVRATGIVKATNVIVEVE